ncbi:hypothetical protein SNEBB_002962 [Seison nebaliae]|nr:hypothetical protein SNEBB_002962 [Seison nebaliae]
MQDNSYINRLLYENGNEKLSHDDKISDMLLPDNNDLLLKKTVTSNYKKEWKGTLKNPNKIFKKIIKEKSPKTKVFKISDPAKCTQKELDALGPAFSRLTDIQRGPFKCPYHNPPTNDVCEVQKTEQFSVNDPHRKETIKISRTYECLDDDLNESFSRPDDLPIANSTVHSRTEVEDRKPVPPSLESQPNKYSFDLPPRKAKKLANTTHAMCNDDPCDNNIKLKQYRQALHEKILKHAKKTTFDQSNVNMNQRSNEPESENHVETKMIPFDTHSNSTDDSISKTRTFQTQFFGVGTPDLTNHQANQNDCCSREMKTFGFALSRDSEIVYSRKRDSARSYNLNNNNSNNLKSYMNGVKDKKKLMLARKIRKMFKHNKNHVGKFRYNLNNFGRLLNVKNEDEKKMNMSNNNNNSETIYRKANRYKNIQARKKDKVANEQTFEGNYAQKTIDDYRLGPFLGRGGFGFVFLCQCKESQSVYAVKCIRWGQIEDERERAALRNEQAIHSSLKNNFILPLVTTFASKYAYHLVLDYCATDLWALHKKNADLFQKFSDSLLKYYAAGMYLGLEYMHQLDIIHRDFKTPNILITTRGHIKITDFGLSARKVNEFCTTLAGTPCTMAPEVFLARPYHWAVDWWAYGCVLFELWQNKTPFHTKVCWDAYAGWEKHYYSFNHKRKIGDRSCYLIEPGEDFNIHTVRFNPSPNVNPELYEMIVGLLQVKPIRRLGSSTKEKCRAIRRQKYFRGFNWEEMLLNQTMPPLLPKGLKSNQIMYRPAHHAMEEIFRN